MSIAVSLCSHAPLLRSARSLVLSGLIAVALPLSALAADTQESAATGVTTASATADTVAPAVENSSVATLGVATSGAATSATPSVPAATHLPAPGSAVAPTSPLNMMLGLLFLLALVGLAWWFVKRTGGAQWQSARAMKVVTSLPVGTRERVVLIEVGGQQLLIGVAPGRVNFLHRFDEPVVTDTGGGDDFASKIRQVMQQGLNR